MGELESLCQCVSSEHEDVTISISNFLRSFLAETVSGLFLWPESKHIKCALRGKYLKIHSMVMCKIFTVNWQRHTLVTKQNPVFSCLSQTSQTSYRSCTEIPAHWLTEMKRYSYDNKKVEKNNMAWVNHYMVNYEYVVWIDFRFLGF